MRFARMLAVFILLTTLALNPAAAQKEKGETVTLTTPKGIRLAATYWKAPTGKKSPVLVLLHGKNGNRKKWNPIAAKLQPAGYSVIAVDLRKHGESAGAPSAPPDKPTAKKGRSKKKDIEIRAQDYFAMVADDMEAVKLFIYQRHQAGELNMRKTGIVAIGPMCAVAIGHTITDWARKPFPDGPTLATKTPKGQDVQTLFLISPDANVKGLPGMVNGIRGNLLRLGLSVHTVVGERDKKKKASADKIMKAFSTGMKEDARKVRFKTLSFKIKINGEALITDPKDAAAMAKYIKELNDERLKKIEQPWRDRRSKLNK